MNIYGQREDGVLLVGLGSRQVVLLNVADALASHTMDELAADAHGPWKDFMPTPELRQHATRVLRAAKTVRAEQVGPAPRTEGPSRAALRKQLLDANLDADEVLPEAKSLLPDGEFWTRCMEDIIPQLEAQGQKIDDHDAFADWLHHERTGLWPA